MPTSALDHPYLHHPDLEPGAPIAFAHRGGTDAAPENTVAAFDHAVGLGYRYLETDVHRTADGGLVAFHDPDLRRTAGVEATIAEMTSADVAAVSLGDGHRIPTLDELFERYPHCHFNIDAKSDEAVVPLVDLVRRRGELDRVCLASFSRRRIRDMHRALGSGLLTAMSTAEVALLRLGAPTSRDRGMAAQVPASSGPLTVVDPRFVDRAHRRGIPVHVWTINEVDEVHRLLDLGVDGIMTDEVAMLRSAYVDRGLWPT